MKGNKRTRSAALTASVLLTAAACGCAVKEEAVSVETDSYIAVYKEILPETEVTAEEEHIELPEPYSYSYLDNIMFVGGDVCSGFLTHSLMSEKQVISEEKSSFSSVMDIKTDKGTVSELVSSSEMKYIYLWTGIDDISEGMDEDEYAREALSSAKKLRKASEDSMVIILGCPPVGKDTGISGIKAYNKAVKNAVAEYREEYEDDSIEYMDIFSLLADSEGYLDEVYDYGDGIGLSRTAYRKLLTELEDKRFYNSLSGDMKYTYYYKELYAERPDYEVTEGKVAYLTFDDGPSKYTPEILRILEENDIKATFFITGWCIEGKEETLKQVADAGHTIGMHSWSHEYEEIYASVNAFLEDAVRVYNYIYDITGQKPWSFRFPGGSYNNFNKETADDIIAEMNRRGFSYYDWNCATSDATRSATYDSCIEELSDSLYSDHSVVLMHDSLELTPQYLQEVIDILRSEGYSFETIDTADVVQF